LRDNKSLEMMDQIDYNFSKSEQAKGTQKRAASETWFLSLTPNAVGSIGYLAPLSATGKMPVPQKINFLVEQASCLFIKG
jgi:hypothetical protein